ncbi:MAG: ornithine cyclodeaminase family protein [Deltaproteobacteria bacterium]|nr:ornithine cyclodeaminase family protein [Deltaproteobacteria bacterium]MBI3295382.1 ornithine cyclodeaminase family protein [Deltaproteobacteria bacterium]
MLNSDTLEACLDHKGLRLVMREALVATARGLATSSPRFVEPIGNQRAMGAMMGASHSSLGAKVVAVFPNNRSLGLNPHQGLVLLMDHLTGQLRALVDGSTLTALRTAAVSAAATEALARPSAHHLAVIGTGRQSYEHIRSFLTFLPIERITVCGRSEDSARLLLSRLRREFPTPDIATTPDPQLAVRDADLVVTCTTSRVALLATSDLRPGTHLNAIGACRPGAQELRLINRPELKIFVDSYSACAAEAEELRGAPHVVGEIGAVMCGGIAGRRNDAEITFFKSVGLGIEDVAAAEFFVDRARQLGVGQTIDL